MNPLGFTRTCVRRDHALICPDSHVQAALPGWTGTKGIILISPEMGARFTQYFALMEPGAVSGEPAAGVQRFVYVLEGAVRLEADGATADLGPGHFAYLPAATPHRLIAVEGTVGGSTQPVLAARLVIFEKRYVAPADGHAPGILVGRERDSEATPFMGDEHARLKLLLPDRPEFDMAVNIFTFDPGAALPLVETHVMEHGLLMLRGQGIYRLGDCWYPVQAGDVIWMASYCPQWFAAINPGPSQYLYYKDVNRDPLA